MTINIAMVDIKVSKKGHDFNEREKKLFEVLLLNIGAAANMVTTKQGMMQTPMTLEGDELFSYQIAWQKSIPKEQYEEFLTTLKRRYETAFKMSDLEDITMEFLENSYLNK